MYDRGVCEVCGHMHPNQCHVTILFAHALLSLSGYLMVTCTHPVANI